MRGHAARAFTLVSLSSLAARAEAPVVVPEMELRIAGCPEELAAALPAVIKLEIDVLLRERGSTQAGPERIAIQCMDDTARIAVILKGDSRDSTLELGVLAPEHRARAVGLATAELVHSLSNRDATRAAEAAPSVTPPPAATPARSTAQPSSTRAAAPRPSLFAGGIAEWLGEPATALFGIRGALHYPLGRVVVPALSVDGAVGGFSASSAHVAVTNLTTALHLYFGTATGSLRWEAGPGARFGWVHLAGEPDAGSPFEGHALAAVWGGPEARARIQYGELEQRFPRIALELGAGYVALPVRGLVDGGKSLYAIEGAWLSACLALGLGL